MTHRRHDTQTGTGTGAPTDPAARPADAAEDALTADAPHGGESERVASAEADAARAADEQVGTELAAEEATTPDSPTVDAPSPAGEEETAAAEVGGDPDPTAEQAHEIPADDRSPAELRAALIEAERARDQYLDFLRRERAEFENFRKRSNRERMDALDRGAEQLVANLLGVLDNFSLALEAAGKSEDEQLAKGVEMVHNELLAALRSAGLDEVAGAGAPFDPEIHEAMLFEEANADESRDEPIVVEVLRPGYRFKRRVLRPASVKVTR